LSPDGVLDGTPLYKGLYNFNIIITDSAQPAHSITRFYSIAIYEDGEFPPVNLTNGPNLGTFAIGTIQIQLNGSGGDGSYHVSLTPGAPPIPGMRVQDGQPLPTFFGSGAPGGFLGVITATGVYSTSIRITDAVSPDKYFDKAVTFRVVDSVFLSQTSS